MLNDVFSATGTIIMNYILSCESYRPEQLLQYVHGKVKASRADIKEALTGYVTSHHRFMLKTIMKNIERVETTVAEVEQQIEACIEPYKIERELLEIIPGSWEKWCNQNNSRSKS